MQKPGTASGPRLCVRAARPSLLPEERLVDVGAVNIGMAAGAGHQLIRPRAHPIDRVVGHATMALVAERVDRRHVQQASILRSVGRVAADAALGLDGSMLIHKRPARFGVALCADGILIGGGFEVVRLEGAVWIVAIAAANRAFVHRMVERHIECRLLIAMALEAELGLFGLEQALRSFGMVDAVAAEAADAGFGMRGTLEIRMGAGVAAQAGGTGIFGAEFVEAADLGDIASAIDVSFAGSVTAFAGHAFTGMFEGEAGVGIAGIGKFFDHIGVTSGASLLTDEVRRVVCRLRLGSGRWLLAAGGSERQPGSCEPGQKQKKRHAGKKSTHAYFTSHSKRKVLVNRTTSGSLKLQLMFSWRIPVCRNGTQ